MLVSRYQSKQNPGYNPEVQSIRSVRKFLLQVQFAIANFDCMPEYPLALLAEGYLIMRFKIAGSIIFSSFLCNGTPKWSGPYTSSESMR